MVFPVEIPMRKHRITFAIWDKDLLSANDYISEATFDFTTAAQRAFIKEETTEVPFSFFISSNFKDSWWTQWQRCQILDSLHEQQNC